MTATQEQPADEPAMKAGDLLALYKARNLARRLDALARITTYRSAALGRVTIPDNED